MSFLEAVSLGLLCTLCLPLGWSQEARGTVLGRMTDSTRAVVPDANIAVANLSTGITTKLTTNESGYYQASFLLLGMYRLSAEAAGFLTANVPKPFAGLVPGTGRYANAVSRVSLLTAYPQFGAANTTDNHGYSWYHSLQLKADKRFSKAYTQQGSYTLSKFIEATSYLMKRISPRHAPSPIRISSSPNGKRYP